MYQLNSILYEQIHNLLIQARSQVKRAINVAMVRTYFEIGRLIVEDEQKGDRQAEYGKEVLQQLSKKLTAEFGRGFSRPNLQDMKQLYLIFKNCQTLSDKLSWSHYVLLIRVDDERARNFYMKETENEHWSVRELDRQINSALFERLVLSRDKGKVKALSEKGQIIDSPKDLIKDPYILEFLNLPEYLIF